MYVMWTHSKKKVRDHAAYIFTNNDRSTLKVPSVPLVRPPVSCTMHKHVSLTSVQFRSFCQSLIARYDLDSHLVQARGTTLQRAVRRLADLVALTLRAECSDSYRAMLCRFSSGCTDLVQGTHLHAHVHTYTRTYELMMGMGRFTCLLGECCKASGSC
jgi:hypothetical protein